MRSGVLATRGLSREMVGLRSRPILTAAGPASDVGGNCALVAGRDGSGC